MHYFRLPPAPVLGAGCVLLAVLTGCSPLQHRNLNVSNTGLPPAVELHRTPFHAQTAHHCGPAALAMVLNDKGVATTPARLTPLVYTPDRQGSFFAELLAAVRRHKRVAYPIESGFEGLLVELAGGRPVLVMQNLGLNWYPRWHYAVAIGYDLDRREIILRSGERRRHVLGFSTFERTWRRSGYRALLVLNPGELPAHPEPLRYLQAVGELERLGFYKQANSGYKAATNRWPDNVTSWMGSGNTFYRLNRPEDAERAYRRALAIDPEYAPAYNNLAQVLLERGELKKAETAARAAVSRGGSLSATYRQTLKEILESARASAP